MSDLIEHKEYDISGVGNERTILLVHGIRMTRKMWLPQMLGLSDAYRLVALDLPGHGANSKIRFQLDHSVEIINRIISQNSYKRVLIVGISLGGYIATKFVSEYADRTLGLVLVGCSAITRGIRTIPHQAMSIISMIIDHSILTIFDKHFVRKSFRKEYSESIINSGFYYKAIPDVIRQMKGHNFLKYIARYDKPVLILNGEKDFIFRTHEELYREVLKKSELVIIKRAKHVCNLEEPEIFNDHLRLFANSLNW